MNEKIYFKYGENEIAYLKSKDSALGKAIDEIGHVYREVIPDMFMALTDDDVCKRLCQIKGIGIWTSEMLMMFSMQRIDIMSWNDMAIIRGLRMLYGHTEITKKLFEDYKKKYSPYGTVASFYLWQISHGACDGLVDNAPKMEKKQIGQYR